MRRLGPGILLLLLPPLAQAAQPIPVEIIQTEDGGWTLLRDGEPYRVRGAGGSGPLDALAATGANSVRTWGVGPETRALLDEAHALGLTVTVGLWLGHERHGFDYDDPNQVAAQLAEVGRAVQAYRDHPAVLAWGIGNEMEGFEAGDDPAIWAAVEEAAALVKELDPLHPTLTVTAEMGGARVASVRDRCPSIDIHGVNAYGGAASVPDRYVELGGTKPLLLTEYGPQGSWEAPKTSWGAALEPTSTQKSDAYVAAYAALDSSPLGIGSYAFTWGHKMEATPTWFGLLLPDGSTVNAVDALSTAWSGAPPSNRTPVTSAITIDRGAELAPGTRTWARIEATDPDGDPIEVTWRIRRDSFDLATGGDFRALPPAIDQSLTRARADRVRVKAPQYPGAYRLYATVRDGQGHAATANVPFLVTGAKPPGLPLPVDVFADGLEGMLWVPSGWMGQTEHLDLSADAHAACDRNGSCLRVQYTGRSGWGGIAWQHPPNDWGKQEGGYDLRSARVLTFRARGERGGERIDVGVGLLGDDVEVPDSGRTETRSVSLTSRWKTYRISLADMDRSRIKTAFYVNIAAEGPPVVVYVDDIRFE